MFGGPTLTEIHLKFLPEFDEPLIYGRKTATSRTKRHGKKGDTFEHRFYYPNGCPVRGCTGDDGDGHDHIFELITDPVRVHLGLILDNLWDIEGCADRDEAWANWRRIYDKRAWAGHEQVWLHRFRMVE